MNDKPIARVGVVAAVLIATIATPAAFAQDVSPGLWEITMETRIPGSDVQAVPPSQMTQCLKASDAAALVGAISNPGARDCSYTEKNYSGNTFRFAMVCSGAFALKTRGEFSFMSTSLSGTITAIANVGGQATELTNKVTARRIGGC